MLSTISPSARDQRNDSPAVWKGLVSASCLAVPLQIRAYEQWRLQKTDVEWTFVPAAKTKQVLCPCTSEHSFYKYNLMASQWVHSQPMVTLTQALDQGKQRPKVIDGSEENSEIIAISLSPYNAAYWDRESTGALSTRFRFVLNTEFCLWFSRGQDSFSRSLFFLSLLSVTQGYLISLFPTT